MELEKIGGGVFLSVGKSRDICASRENKRGDFLSILLNNWSNELVQIWQ